MSRMDDETLAGWLEALHLPVSASLLLRGRITRDVALERLRRALDYKRKYVAAGPPFEGLTEEDLENIKAWCAQAEEVIDRATS
ncbi:MAG TPA: hypothetical protein VFX35_00425 [Solirubrobacterales bacterium]|nr:hypothetical protein [Solirubrobacterales bacterium]